VSAPASSGFRHPGSARRVALAFWAEGISAADVRATNDTPMLAEIADALEAIESEGGAR
jgi:hypothetical protein